MEASDIEVTITATDLAGLVAKLNEAERSAKAYCTMLEEEREEHKNYKIAEAEREEHVRRQNECEYARRAKVLGLNERKVNAYQAYHNTYALCLDHILSILSQRITKADRAAIEKERKTIGDAWDKFDAVQKECASQLSMAAWDPCKTKMPPSSLSHDYVDKEGAKE